MNILIADSGATKTTWCLVMNGKSKTFHTAGISPYFFTSEEITALLKKDLLPKLKGLQMGAVHFYGTGCATPENCKLVQQGLKRAFGGVKKITVNSDLLGAARAVCGSSKGVACILGTGSNSCVYNGKSITRNNPAPGFILGDEGSGAYLGKKTVQYFIYNTFDEELMHRFQQKFETGYRDILQKVYKEPWPNRYLASFAPFLSENRDHFMVENIIEDGLSDFFYTHLYKYPETWKYPIHFMGSIAWHFRDVLKELCGTFEVQLGSIVKSPMPGLVKFHS